MFGIVASVSVRGRHFDAATGRTPPARGRVLRSCAPVCSIPPHVSGPRIDKLAPGKLAQPPCHSATEVLRPGSAGARRGRLSRLPPLVVSWEIEALRTKLAQAQRGEQFLLQGGDCAESFEDCESDNIAKRLKILLQMSLVLLQGLKKPVIRVGRFAGQYAKPRSADTETRAGVTLPSYRGDNVNRPGFSAAERSRILSSYCAATSALP